MTKNSQRNNEPKGILTHLKEYFIMTLGMCIYSFGWIGCVLPAKSTSGAASGLAIVISTALENTMGWDVKIGTIVFIIQCRSANRGRIGVGMELRFQDHLLHLRPLALDEYVAGDTACG